MRIGWYIHHHGRGHLTRLRAIAPHLHADIECFSSLPAPPGLPERVAWTVLDRDDDPLPDGRDPAASDPTAGGLFHWAPLGHRGHAARLSAIASALAARPVDAFVVDVSAEVALFVRLLGVPVVVIAQPGIRDDAPHELAYRSATRIVAPWPGALYRPAHLEAFADITVYTGGVSRFEGRMRSAPASDVVLLFGGAGGTAVTDAQVAAAERATGADWRLLGAGAGAGRTWVDDPWDALSTARVVVSWAGQNAIADLAAANARAVVVPQERPFREQVETARALDRAGLAVVAPAWPEADEWPALLERAAASRPEWTRWEVDGAAARAAHVISTAASTREPSR